MTEQQKIPNDKIFVMNEDDVDDLNQDENISTMLFIDTAQQ